MQLAIATHSGLFLCDYEDSLLVKQLSIGYYYGIAAHEGFFLTARRIDPFSKESPTAFEQWTYDGLCCGTPELLAGNSIQDCHQVTASDRGIYICNAHRNSIVFIPHDGSYSRELVVKDIGVANNLINSIYVDGEDLHVVQHNRGERPSEVLWIKHLPDDEIVYCETYRLCEDGIHNIVPHNGRLYFNASDSGAVMAGRIADFNTKDWALKGKVGYKKTIIHEGMHTKGMALDKDSSTLFVGISENGTLSQRFKSKSSLIILNSEDLTFQTAFELKTVDGSAVGNINEIRILD